MKAIIQRVLSASVSVKEKEISRIDQGVLVLIGLKTDDSEELFDPIIKKILNLRIFNDENEIMNRSILDENFEVLLVSQFTLYADCKKGNRPSYMKAMSPKSAKKLYEIFISRFQETYSKVKDGEFGANMQVSLVNDGPITIILEN
jgi:D-aminoacyl-tRNA deacylase